jgi:hypothetical protein
LSDTKHAENAVLNIKKYIITLLLGAPAQRCRKKATIDSVYYAYARGAFLEQISVHRKKISPIMVEFASSYPDDKKNTPKSYEYKL